MFGLDMRFFFFFLWAVFVDRIQVLKNCLSEIGFTLVDSTVSSSSRIWPEYFHQSWSDYPSFIACSETTTPSLIVLCYITCDVLLSPNYYAMLLAEILPEISLVEQSLGYGHQCHRSEKCKPSFILLYIFTLCTPMIIVTDLMLLLSCLNKLLIYSSVGGNRLSGPIPRELGSISSLEELCVFVSISVPEVLIPSVMYIS